MFICIFLARISSISVQYISSSSLQHNIFELKKRVYGPNFTDSQSAGKASETLKKLFDGVKDKNLLIIIDDVKNREEVEEIINAIPNKHRLIITSKQRDLIDDDNQKIETNFTKSKYNRYNLETIIKENNLAYSILKHLTYLDKNNINLDILKRIFIEQDVETCLNYLVECKVLIKKCCEFEPIYILDEMMQNELKRKINQKEKNKIVLKLIQVLNDSLTGENENLQNENKDTLEIIYRHAKEVLEDVDIRSNDFELMSYRKLLDKMIHVNIQIFEDPEEAAFLMKKMLEIEKEQDFIHISDLLRKIGIIFKKQENYKEAFKCYDKALSQLAKIGRNNKHSFISSLNETITDMNKQLEQIDFSELLSKNDQLDIEKILQYNETEVLLKLIVEVKKSLNEDDLYLASIWIFLGLIYRKEKNLEEALNSYNESLRILEKNKQISRIASVLNNVGEIYTILGKKKKAYESYQDALQLLKGLRRPNMELLILTKKNIAINLENTGDCEEALKYYKECLELRKDYRKESPYHIDFADSYDSIGKCNYKLKNYAEAMKNFNDALEIKKECKLPEDDNRMLLSYKYMAKIYRKSENYDAAEKLYLKAIEIWRQKDDDSELSDLLYNIGTFYKRLGKYEDALEAYKESLDLLESDSSQETTIADTYYCIGTVLSLMERFEESLEYHEKALEIRRNKFTPDHSDVVESERIIKNVRIKMRQK